MNWTLFSIELLIAFLWISGLFFYKKNMTGEKMSYVKDSQGNIVEQKWWQKKKELPPAPLPPAPLPPAPEPEPSEERQLLEAVVLNQKAMYELLESIASDIELMKDESVEEATDRFKALQEEVVGQIAELEKKKGKVKK